MEPIQLHLNESIILFFQDAILAAISSGCALIVGFSAKCESALKSSSDQLTALFLGPAHATANGVCKIFQLC